MKTFAALLALVATLAVAAPQGYPVSGGSTAPSYDLPTGVDPASSAGDDSGSASSGVDIGLDGSGDDNSGDDNSGDDNSGDDSGSGVDSRDGTNDAIPTDGGDDGSGTNPDCDSTLDLGETLGFLCRLTMPADAPGGTIEEALEALEHGLEQ